FRELQGRGDLDFNLILGDLVNDDSSLFAPIKTQIDALPMPSWTILGNHDRVPESEPYLDAAFNRHFGAATYAFNYAGVHFVVLNNVFATGKRSYEGRVSEAQMRFLDNTLKNLDPK